jgi:hypothetical protein
LKSESQISDLNCEIPNRKKFSGDSVGRVTPVPIPNTEVKPAGADGTARVTVWESRKSPELINKARESIKLRGLYYFTVHPANSGVGASLRLSFDVLALVAAIVLTRTADPFIVVVLRIAFAASKIPVWVNVGVLVRRLFCVCL